MPSRPQKRQRQRQAVEQFLDLEAAADQDSDVEDLENDEETPFIDQSVIEDGANDYQQHAALLRQILVEENRRLTADEQELRAEEDEEVDEEDFGCHLPSNATSHPTRALPDDHDDDDNRVDRVLGDDDILYEIGCKVGLEEATVYRIFALAMAVELPVPLAKAVISNPHLPGRIYIEPYKSQTMSEILREAESRQEIAEDNLHYEAFADIERLARRMPALRASSIRQVPKQDILRPLILLNVPLPAYAWVKISSPPSLSGCVGFIQSNETDILLFPFSRAADSRLFATPIHQQNVDKMQLIPAPPPPLGSPATVERHSKRGRSYDQYGFRYVRLQDVKLDPEPYSPTVEEIETCHQYGRLPKGQYQVLMSRALAYSLRTGDRVLLRAGECAGLIGTVIQIRGMDADVYVQSEGLLLSVPIRDLRREFRVGDRVLALSDQVAERLGSRIGWVVKDLGPCDSGVRRLIEAEKLTEDTGVWVDIQVYSRESGREIPAAHYEFALAEGEIVASLGMQRPQAGPTSIMHTGKVYMITASGRFFLQKFHGTIREVFGLQLRHESEDQRETTDAVRFVLWDPSEDLAYGMEPHYQKSAIHGMCRIDGINLGDEVSMEDEDGRGGTARITRVEQHELWLANFSGSLQIIQSSSSLRGGPYDRHIGKSVRVIRGVDKGLLGTLKTVNYCGQCTVELSVFPIRSLSTTLDYLQPVDQSQMYLALAPIIRAATPPPPDSFSDAPPVWPIDATLDCSWLEQPTIAGIPVKLEPIGRPLVRPYHFKHITHEYNGGTAKRLVHLKNRKEEKVMPLEALRWLPATDMNQTVVHIRGTDSQLYMTISVDGDNCDVRRVPSKRNDPKYTFPCLELAQVKASRKGK